MRSQRILAGLLSVALATSSTIVAANPQSTEKSVLDRVGQLVKDHKLEIQAELAFIDLIILQSESAQAMNEALSLDRANVYVMVPTVFAGALLAYKSFGSVGSALVQSMTPEKSAWFAQYATLKSNIKGIEKELAEVKKIDPSTLSRPAMMNRMGSLDNSLLKAKLSLSEHMLQKPGTLYKIGRLTRFTGYTSLAVGSVAITAIAGNEIILLVFGRDEFAKGVERLKERSAQLEALLKI